MIQINLNNRSSIVPVILKTWFCKDADRIENADYGCLSSLWSNFFGVGGSWYDDDENNDYPPFYDDYPDDDEDDYGSLLERNTVIVNDKIWDNNELWDTVAHKYDTFEKSVKAINHAIVHGDDCSHFDDYYLTHEQNKKGKDKKNSKTSSDKKNRQKKDDDWRQEVMETLNGYDEKCIYFYDKPKDENSKQTFSELDDFLVYCEDNDIYVDDWCKKDLEFFTQCHCALDEYASANGRKELRCARSYGELIYDLYGSDLYYDDNIPEYATHSNNDGLPY